MAALTTVIASSFVIASEAKQSPLSLRAKRSNLQRDRFVAALLAMTNSLLAMTNSLLAMTPLLSLRAKRSNLRNDRKFSIT